MQSMADLPWIRQYKSFEDYIKRLSRCGVYTTVDLLTRPNLIALGLKAGIAVGVCICSTHHVLREGLINFIHCYIQTFLDVGGHQKTNSK